MSDIPEEKVDHLDEKALENKGLKELVDHLTSIKQQNKVLYGMTTMPSRSKKILGFGIAQ